MAQTLLAWQAPEFEYREKTADWYWAVWIIVVSLSVIAVLFNDVLLAVLIVIGAFTLTILSKKLPRLIQYEITSTGLQVADTLYPYESLESFGIEKVEGMPVSPKLLVKSKKLLMAMISMPLQGVHPDDVRELLKKYLREEDLAEPLIQKFSDLLGF